MAGNACEVRVGRLLEVRADRGYLTLDDVEAMRQSLTLAFERIPDNRPAVITADWRRASLMDGEAAQSASAMMVGFNHRIERSAILVSNESPTAVLQFHHLVREAGHPQRRIFHFEDEVVAWLAELLTPEERARLTEFLARR
ncbi:MAG TPA: hypothetical protein VM686_39625 [Polyangiaceae bacterium]|nr:hypothetical protein [Polyangiaceae bacterium]